MHSSYWEKSTPGRQLLTFLNSVWCSSVLSTYTLFSLSTSHFSHFKAVKEEPICLIQCKYETHPHLQITSLILTRLENFALLLFFAFQLIQAHNIYSGQRCTPPTADSHQSLAVTWKEVHWEFVNPI